MMAAWRGLEGEKRRMGREEARHMGKEEGKKQTKRVSRSLWSIKPWQNIISTFEWNHNVIGRTELLFIILQSEEEKKGNGNKRVYKQWQHIMVLGKRMSSLPSPIDYEVCNIVLRR